MAGGGGAFRWICLGFFFRKPSLDGAAVDPPPPLRFNPNPARVQMCLNGLIERNEIRVDGGGGGEAVRRFPRSFLFFFLLLPRF